MSIPATDSQGVTMRPETIAPATSNRVYLVGTVIDRKPLRWIPNGAAVLKCTVSVIDRFVDKDGKDAERTDTYELTAFGRVAETLNHAAAPGTRLSITGRLAKRTWKDKREREHAALEVICTAWHALPAE